MMRFSCFHSRSQPEIYSFLADFSGCKNELKAFIKIQILKIWRYFDKNLLNKAYELGLKELFARIKKDNEKSLNLLKNSHFLELGILDDKIILSKNLFYPKTCKNF